MHKICLRMHIPAGNHMLKVNNRNTRKRCKKAWKKLGFQLLHKRPHIVEDQNLAPRFPIFGWSKFDFLMIHATNEQKWWAGLGTFILFEVSHEFSIKGGSNLFRDLCGPLQPVNSPWLPQSLTNSGLQLY